MTGHSFSCRSARSAPLAWGVSLAILVETAVLHLWMVSRFPFAIWALTLMGVGSVAWLIADYSALGNPAVTVRRSEVEFTVGRRVRGRVAPSRIAAVRQASWREVPPPGTPGFINATKPAEPNVLVAFAGEVPLRVIGYTRHIRLLGLHLDKPEAVVAALGALAATGAAPETTPETTPERETVG